jgi:nucleoside-diphosphate-sugar epimerase
MRNRYLLAVDLPAFAIAAFGAFALRFDWFFYRYRPEFWAFLAAALVCKPVIFYFLTIYRRFWRYASLHDLIAILVSVTAASVLLAALTALALACGVIAQFSRPVLLIDWLLTLCIVGGIRMSVRFFMEVSEHANRRPLAGPLQRALLVGASETATNLLREIRRSRTTGLTPIGFVDDDPVKLGKRIQGLTVLGPVDAIPTIVREHGVGEVIVALPEASGEAIRRIGSLCERAKVPSVTVSTVYRSLYAETRRYVVEHVLVIGGAGYIGSTLCRELLRRGYRVRILDALFYGDHGIRELTKDPRCELIKGDTRDVTSVVLAMRDVQAVVHLGEIVGDPATGLDEDLTRQINVAATRMIAEVAKGYQAWRFIYASSCSVYGASDDILTEESALAPVSLYAKAKIASEHSVLGLADLDFCPTVLRFATVYGISPRPRFDLVINLLSAKAVVDREITVVGGTQWRPFVHVSDVAAAIIGALEADPNTVMAAIYNVGSDDQNYTINDIGEIVCSLIPGTRVVRSTEVRDQRNYRVSFEKIRRELGFRPQFTVQAGVTEVADVVRRKAVGWYRDAVYSNYKTLSDENALVAIRGRKINELFRVVQS